MFTQLNLGRRSLLKTSCHEILKEISGKTDTKHDGPLLRHKAPNVNKLPLNGKFSRKDALVVETSVWILNTALYQRRIRVCVQCISDSRGGKFENLPPFSICSAGGREGGDEIRVFGRNGACALGLTALLWTNSAKVSTT